MLLYTEFRNQTISVFHNSQITRNSQNRLPSVVKDVYLNNCSKIIQYKQKYLLTFYCFIVFLLHFSVLAFLLLTSLLTVFWAALMASSILIP